MSSWVHRRVENCLVIDDVAVTRRSSIDFTLPEEVNGVSTERALRATGECFVPLTFLAKERLRSFDLRAPDNRPVPMLSRRDNGQLATNVLVSQAEAVLQRALPCEMLAFLRDVARGSPSDARDALALWRRYATDTRHPQRAEWGQLVARAGFMELANALAGEFLVCAVFDAKPGSRRILKLSYETEFGALTRRLLSWRFTLLEFEARQSRLADSYHFELLAPPDMEAVGALLAFEALPESNDPVPPDDIDEPEAQRVHLYSTSVPSSVDANAYVFLRARRQGNLRAAVLTGLLATAILWLGFVELEEIADGEQSQVAAALLLLGPTLLAAALVRPGEHKLVTRVFFWARVLTVGCMVSLLTAVGLLAGAAPEIRDDAWLAASVFASLCFGGLATMLVLPRQP